MNFRPAHLLIAGLLQLVITPALIAATYTWNGSASTAWNNGANWTGDGGWPDGNNDIAIISVLGGNQCHLHANETIDEIYLSGTGYLDLGGFQLYADDKGTLTGGNIGNGELQCDDLTEFTNTTTFGDFTFRKNNSGGHLTWSGGNTFGNVTIINEDNNRRIRMANSIGDTFNGTVTIQNDEANWIQVAYGAACTFAEDATVISGDADSKISFGENGGSAVFAAGKCIKAGAYASGDNLELYNVTSPGLTAFGSVTVSDEILIENSSIAGDITLVVTGGNNNIEINGSTLSATVNLTADNIEIPAASNFSTVSGSTTIIKTNGGNDDTWAGGNVYGPVSITNQDAGDYIRISNVAGDTYNSTATFTNSSSGFIDISYAGASTFAEDVSITNTDANGFIRIGENGGTSVLAATKSLISASYAVGDRFICKQVTSPGTAAFGTVQVTDAIDFTASSINGDIVATSTGGNQQILLDGTTLSASATLTGDNVQLNNVNNCATVSGTCTITKTNGGNDDAWDGGNTFGALVITNQDAGDYIRLSSTNGSNFNSTASFINSSSGFIDISYNGASTFAEDVSITNTDANGFIRIGENGGTSVLAATKSLISTSYAVGDRFICKQVTSPGTTAFGTVQVTNAIDFTASSINGDIVATSTGGNQTITLNGTTLSANTTLTADNVKLNNANNCATVSGTCTITKTNGGGDDDWDGGNTFGPAVITNQDGNDRIRLASTNGETFTSTASFVNSSTNFIDISYNGASTFADNVSITNSDANGYIRMGQNGGTSVLAAGKYLFTPDYNQGDQFICKQVTSPGTTAFGTVQVTNAIDFTASSINGDITAISTGGNQTITLNGSTLSAAANLTADNINLNNGNALSTVSGNCTITKTEGGGNNDWDGGNTFGQLPNMVTIRNQDNNRRIRMADTNGDTFEGNVTFDQQDAGDLQPAYNSTSIFKGNISTQGTTNTITFGDGNGVVEIGSNGAAQTFLTDVLTKPTVARLTMNTSGGGSLTLDGPVDVDNTLTMTSGILHTDEGDGDLLTLTDEGVGTNIGSASSYVNGPLDWQFTNNGGGRSSLTCPIGRDEDYSPLLLEVSHSANTSYTYRVQMVNSSARDLLWTKPGTIKNVSNIRYYDINRFLTSSMVASGADLRTGASGPQLTLYYFPSDAVSDELDLRIVKNTSAAPTTWFDIGGVGTASGTGTITSSSAPTAFNGFSRFALANGSGGDNTLPVELVEFTAIQENTAVRVEWTVTAEINNDYWEIERSYDGVTWEVIQQIPSKGNIASERTYTFYDIEAFEGEVYYRLQQYDVDGQSSGSEIEQIDFDDEVPSFMESEELFLVYPNPADKQVTVLCSEQSFSAIQVFDLLGREVTSKVSFKSDGERRWVVDVSRLKRGWYLFECGVYSQKLLKK